MTGHKRRVGWLVGCVADLSFAVWGVATRQYGFVFGSAVFFLVRVRNFLLWADPQPQKRKRFFLWSPVRLVADNPADSGKLITVHSARWPLGKALD